jgi:hypothetical protein
VNPTSSFPSAFNSAAAAELSTPPLMATAIFIKLVNREPSTVTGGETARHTPNRLMAESLSSRLTVCGSHPLFAALFGEVLRCLSVAFYCFFSTVQDNRHPAKRQPAI